MHETDAEYYLTTRLDNDDALALDFVAETQKLFKKSEIEEGTLIFENGIQYEEKRSLAIFYRFKTNHFSTLVSKREERIKTILDFGHMEVATNSTVKSVNNMEPMWMEVIHGTNVSNRMHFKYNDILQDFDIYKAFAVSVQCEKRKPFQLKLMAMLNKPNNAVRLFRQYGVKKMVDKLIKRIRHK